MFFRDGKLIPFAEFVGSNDALDFFKSQGVDTSQGYPALISAWKNAPEVKDFLGKRQDFHFNEELRKERDRLTKHWFGDPSETVRPLASNTEAFSLGVDYYKEAAFRQDVAFKQIEQVIAGNPMLSEHGQLMDNFTTFGRVHGVQADIALPSQRERLEREYIEKGSPRDLTIHGNPREQFVTIHGSSEGDLYDAGGKLPLERVDDLKNAYVACCYPNQVQGKYPFLKIRSPESTVPSFVGSSKLEVIDDPVSTFNPSISSHTSILPVSSTREKVTEASRMGFDLVSPLTEMEDVIHGRRPALFFAGTKEEFKKSFLLSTTPDDNSPLKAAKTAVQMKGSGALVEFEEEFELGNKGYFLGKPETIEKIKSLIQENQHLDLDAVFGAPFAEQLSSLDFDPETEAFDKEIRSLLGYTPESTELRSFLRRNELDEHILPIYPANPYQIDVAGDARLEETIGSVKTAVVNNLSPKEMLNNIIENSKEIAKAVDKEGGLPPAPAGPTFRSVRTNHLRAQFLSPKGSAARLEAKFGREVLEKLVKIGKVGGLALALGIGVPAVASASTGAVGGGGGLGSTLITGAAIIGGIGVATGLGVAAYKGAKAAKIPSVLGNIMSGPGGGTINRNTGSRIYNSGFIQGELDLTTRGFFAGIGSVINDFGLNRRISGFDQSGKASGFLDSFFGKALGSTGYVHPVYRAEEAFWQVANNLDDAYQGWKNYISTSASRSSGIAKFFHGARYSGFKLLDSVGDGWLNKQLVKMGGLSTMIAPALMGYGAIGDFKSGYRTGGVLGGIGNTALGITTGLVQNKVIAGALLNPAIGLTGGAVAAAAGYTAFKVFDVRNKGAQYMRSGRMGGISWNRGPTPGMSSSMGASVRQRAINAMENSRFSAMKAIGNESYMMSAPKARYSSSTAIYGTSSMLSY